MNLKDWKMACVNFLCRQLRGGLHSAKLQRYRIALKIAKNKDKLLADEITIEDALKLDREYIQLLKGATARARYFRSRITAICPSC